MPTAVAPRARGGDDRAPVAGPEVDHVVLCGDVGHVEHLLARACLPVGTQTTSLPCWPTVGSNGALGSRLSGFAITTFASVVTVADFGGGGDVVIQKTNPIPIRAVKPTTSAA